MMTSTAIPVLIPLLNPNEPEARLVSLNVQNSQQVSTGEVLCTLETTKSAIDLTTEAGGYITGLRFAEGQFARAGEILCYVAGSPDWSPPGTSTPHLSTGVPHTESATTSEIPTGLRISQPALALAQQANLDLGALPIGPLITEKMVRAMLERNQPLAIPQSSFDPTAIIIYGGGGHGKALIDLIRSIGVYRIHGIVDDGLAKSKTVLGFPVLGGAKVLTDIYAQGVRLAVNAVGGIGNLNSRVSVFQKLAEAGFACPILIHPSAVVEPSANLSPGVQIFPHSYVGSEAQLGFGVIVNTSAVVSHDFSLGDCANISPGALLAGEVKIGAGVLVGMGVTINLGVKIGANARIGNSATVKGDVPEGGIVRAGTTWPQ